MSCYATVVIGAPLHEVIKIEVKKIPKIKYDEDTGEPYTKLIEETFFIIGDNVFSEKEDAIDALSKAGLTLFESCTNYQEGIKLIGLSVVSLSSEKKQAVTEIDNISLIKVVDMLRELGYNGNVNLYLTMVCSY